MPASTTEVRYSLDHQTGRRARTVLPGASIGRNRRKRAFNL